MATQIVLGSPSKLRVAPFAGAVMMMTQRPGFVLKASATLGAAEDGRGAAFAECRVFIQTADRAAAQADVDKMSAALAEGRSVFVAPNPDYAGDEPLKLTAVRPWRRDGKSGVDLVCNAQREAVVLSRSESVKTTAAMPATPEPEPVAAAAVAPVAPKAARSKARPKAKAPQLALGVDAI